MAAFRAFLHYERHVGITEPITASKLAKLVALHADDNKLPDADLLVPTNAAMREMARDLLETLRVCPESLAGIAEPSQHEPDRGKADEGNRSSGEVLEIFCQPTTAP